MESVERGVFKSGKKWNRSREECLKVESVKRGVFKSGIGPERSV